MTIKERLHNQHKKISVVCFIVHHDIRLDKICIVTALKAIIQKL